MKEVKITKHPSLIQMSNMAFNLRKKYKIYCSVDSTREANAHGSDLKSIVTIDIKFKIYISPTFREYDSWSDLQRGYQMLMEV